MQSVAVVAQEYQMNSTDRWYDVAKNIHRELLKYMYGQHLPMQTMPNISRIFESQNNYGWTSLAFDIEGMSHKPANARSMPSLLKKIEKYGYQYYRPNLSYTSKSHKKCQLRWMVGLFFDFDAENLSALNITSHEQLIEHVESMGYEVCAVIKTSSGYHVYLPMQALRGQWNGEQTIKRYDTVLKRIARQIGSDVRAASAEHYFRTPTSENVVYFCPLEKPAFEFYEEVTGITEESISEIADGSVSFGKVMSQKPMLMLLAGEFNPRSTVVGHKVGRNNAAFTLALGMKCDNWPIEKAEEELHDWYMFRINRYDFTWDEVKRALQQAYEKDWKGPKSMYVEALTGMKLRPVSRKLDREQRVRMHYSEIEEILITYLKRYQLEFGVDVVMSQAKLAETLEVKLRSLQVVLKDLQERKILDLETLRQGRSNVSVYFLAKELLHVQAEAIETHSIQENLGGTAGSQCTQNCPSEASTSVYQKPAGRPIFHTAISNTYFCAIGRRSVLQLAWLGGRIGVNLIPLVPWDGG